MGCDIHLCVEERTGGAWQNVPAPKGWDKSGVHDEWFPGRSYKVFARLADVRNDLEGRTRETPIGERRGIPVDASDAVRQRHEDYDLDAHSASWFGVDELARHDWTDYYCIGEIIEWCRARGPLEAFRIVFWFDN